MSETTSYVPAIEVSRRMGWTMAQVQDWAREHHVQHPRFGWLIERGRAEELVAARSGR